jgi:preprotein translocase subunit SecG
MLIQASCRRNLILKVVLIDAFGEAVKDREVRFFLKKIMCMLLYLFSVCIFFLQIYTSPRLLLHLSMLTMEQ